jgi:hypothetical protein
MTFSATAHVLLQPGRRLRLALLALLVCGASARAADGAPTARGSVIDLCTRREPFDGKRSIKQRGVVLGPAGLERFDADPKLAALGASAHARETIVARFPLDRLYDVVSTLPGDPSWLGRASVPLAEVEDTLARAALPRPFAGDEPGGDERERAFVRYSLGCADWVLVPVVERVDVRWDNQRVELRELGVVKTAAGARPGFGVEAREMWLPQLDVTLRVGVFYRRGDALVRSALVSGGSRKRSGMPDLPPASWGAGVPAFVSAIPIASCAIPPHGIDDTKGLACPAGTASAALLSHGKNEFSDHVCQARTMENPDQWAVCAVRLETELAVGGAQKQVRELPELRLFDEERRGNPLDPDGPALAIGRHEGVKVGYGFFTKDAEGNMTSFARVLRPGPGGAAGEFERTALRLRFGDARPGERAFEYPQSNLYFGVRLETGPLYGMAPPTVFPTGPLARTVAAFPDWVGGLGLSSIWDASGAVNWTEFRTGVEAHALAGATPSVRMLALPIDFPNLEKGWTLGRMKLFASLAFSAGWLFVSLAELDSWLGIPRVLQGYLVGGAAALGLELMLTPDLLVRVDVSGRAYGLASVTTTAETQALDARDDHYAALVARLSFEFGM